jgi:hypothetical protein
MTAASECVSETLWKIKPLVWEDNHLGSVVDSVFGDITILRTRSKWLFEELHDTLDSAKAAAESWYADKLRTALEPAAITPANAKREAGDEHKALAETLSLLRALHYWRGVGEDSVTLWEKIAQDFHKDTGYLRPGKDVPSAISHQGYEADQRKAWSEWVDRKNNELDSYIVAAIEAATAALRKGE